MCIHNTIKYAFCFTILGKHLVDNNIKVHKNKYDKVSAGFELIYDYSMNSKFN